MDRGFSTKLVNSGREIKIEAISLTTPLVKTTTNALL